jgi:hypothetical protein
VVAVVISSECALERSLKAPCRYDRHAVVEVARLGLQSERPARTIARTEMPLHQRDYFAELYVAGLMGDNGRNVYFPKRDIGFDFIATKSIESSVLIRPVQVKGLYPSEAKKDKTGYGYIGTLSQVHDDMVLVLPYFPRTASALRLFALPSCLALRFAHSWAGDIRASPQNSSRDALNHGRHFGSSLALTGCATWNS